MLKDIENKFVLQNKQEQSNEAQWKSVFEIMHSLNIHNQTNALSLGRYLSKKCRFENASFKIVKGVKKYLIEIKDF